MVTGNYEQGSAANAIINTSKSLKLHIFKNTKIISINHDFVQEKQFSISISARLSRLVFCRADFTGDAYVDESIKRHYAAVSARQH